MITIVGLMGYAGSGKDAAAQALVEDGWRRDAFADRMRAMLYALNPIVFVDQFGGYERLRALVGFDGWDRVKRDVPEVRELLQRLGTEAGREILGENVWVDALMNAWERAVCARTVVTDVRFPNEYRAIREAGGLLVRIERPGVEAVNGHASEHALRDFVPDVVIENGGTLADLHASIRLAIGHGPVRNVATVEDKS